MREKFERKQGGDQLSSSRDWNPMADVAERVAGLRGGSNINVRHGRSFVSVSGTISFHQDILSVYSVEGSKAGLYLGRLVEYNHQTEVWAAGMEDYLIDANSVRASLGIGQRVVCYWDEIRGAYVPVTSGCMVVKVTRDGGVAGGSGADCTFTYTVKDFAGAVLDTTVMPERPRYGNCAYLAGGEGGRTSYGLAIYDSGTLKLLVAFGEIEDTTACDEEESSSSSSSVTSSSGSSASSSSTSSESSSSTSSISSSST
ncbi:MAG: hypothetical protein ABIH23_29495, partial [bacterium]